jgi:hypothetical protein
MALSMRAILRRRGALVAVVTSLGLYALFLVQGLLQALVWQLISTEATSTANYLSVALTSALMTSLPFVIGVFLSLWLIAPIGADLHIMHVVMRSGLAAGVGATVVFVVTAIIAVFSRIALAGTLFGNSFPSPSYDANSLPQELGYLLEGALSGFIAQAPVVVLAGVFLWIWLRQHPVRHAVAGLVDEV